MYRTIYDDQRTDEFFAFIFEGEDAAPDSEQYAILDDLLGSLDADAKKYLSEKLRQTEQA
jgi:hypothetical protein